MAAMVAKESVKKQFLRVTAMTSNGTFESVRLDVDLFIGLVL
jgi:hypothetical protein